MFELSIYLDVSLPLVAAGVESVSFPRDGTAFSRVELLQMTIGPLKVGCAAIQLVEILVVDLVERSWIWICDEGFGDKHVNQSPISFAVHRQENATVAAVYDRRFSGLVEVACAFAGNAASNATKVGNLVNRNFFDYSPCF
jgi:hypothetical protein